MSTWNFTNDKILIKEGTLSKTGEVFLISGGFLFLLGGISLLFLRPDGLADGLLPLTSFGIFFGLIMVSTGFYNIKRKFLVVTEIDGKRDWVSLYKNDPSKAIKIPFADFQAILLRKEVRTSSKSTRTTYVIYLIKKDKSAFWLSTDTDKRSFKERVDQLFSILRLPVVNQSDMELQIPTPENYDPVSISAPSWQMSKFVHIKKGVGVTLIEMANPVTFMSLFFTFLIFSFFGFFITMAITQGFKDFNGLGDIALAVFVIVLLFLFSLFLTLKKTVLELRAESLTLSLKLRIKLFDMLLGKKIVIPADAILSIRVHRVERGGFQLGLGLDPRFQLPPFTSLMMNLGFVDNAVLPQDTEKFLSLWEAYFITEKNEGIGFQDLVLLEANLQNTYKKAL